MSFTWTSISHQNTCLGELLMKKIFYSEFAYVFGIVILAFATALMERASFGMSMVVAPAYILHLKISQTLSFFTFGMAEYCLQFVLIVLLSVVMRRVKKGYFFSFVTAVIYGLVLDFWIWFVGLLPGHSFVARCIYFVLGVVICAIGVALLFHTYFAPEAYELVVKELSVNRGASITKVKTIYDISSLLVSVILSFAFFGLFHFEGVYWGTLITALVNGWLIGRISAFLDKKFEFKDRLQWRAFFEQ